jgi:hypothetical protein
MDALSTWGAARLCLDPIMDGSDTFFMSAVTTAEELAARLGAVTNNFAAAMVTFRSQRVDGAFEAIEIMGNSIHDYLKRFIVFIPANFTFSHNPSITFV